MLDWLQQPEVLAGMIGLTLVLFVGGVVAVPMVLARIRPDYFMHRRPPEESWRRRHPVVRYTVLAVKNGLGAALLVAGIGMLVLPGPGIITALVGISLLNFPGKRALERRIVSRPAILRAINGMRQRAGRPPLILPDD